MAFLFIALLCAATGLASAAPVDEKAPDPRSTAKTTPDPLSRGTPRSAVTGLIEALAEHDYERAAQYFVLPVKRQQRIDGPSLARGFQSLLDKGGSLLPYFALSNEPAGGDDDELPLDQERVGKIGAQETAPSILLVRGMDSGREVWRISGETVRDITSAARLVPSTSAGPVEDARHPFEDTLIVAGAPMRDWAVLLGTGALIFSTVWLLSALVLAVVRRMMSNGVAHGILGFCNAAIPPLSLLAALGVFYGWAEHIPVSIVARQTLLRYSGIISVIAVVWFGLRLVDAVAELAVARMQRHRRRQVVSVITLVRRGVKSVLLIFSAVAILDTFGVDVTTGIAALGLGGIALALGAQKTVENLVGSITLIIDRPAQVGDFVKSGDVAGTVEDIGIRSTRIRTGERSVVTVPNGDLSARQIENFAPRDRFLFNPVIAICPATTSARLREAVNIIQGVLHGHEKVGMGARANLARIGERAFDIDVFAYIEVREFDLSVPIREELLISIYERLETAGINLAFASQVKVSQPQDKATARHIPAVRGR